MTPEQKRMMVVFKDTFNFTGDELKLNRQCRLSDHQIKLNRRAWLSEMGTSAIFPLMGVILVGVGWLLSSSSFGYVLCLSIPGVILGGMGVLLLVRQFRERPHLSEKAVKVVEGIVERGIGKPISGSTYFSKRYYFKVADQPIIYVPYAAYTALIPGQRYRLYFPKWGSSKLMSIEMLAEAEREA